MHVLVGGSWSEDEKTFLTALLTGATPVFLSDTPSPESIHRCEAVLVMSWKEVAPHVPHMPRLALVQSFMAGVERIPLAAIPPQVTVATGAGSNAAAVAEHAWALLSALAKDLRCQDRRLREGVFSQDGYHGILLEGKTLCIVGYGHVGSRVGRMARAAGMRTIAVNTSGASDADRTVTSDGLLDALSSAHAVVLAVPHTPATEGLIGTSELEALPDDALFVNVARGPVVDEGALYRHLAARPSFRAGLDVWWRYPRNDEPWSQGHPFETLENVIITPHIAGLAEGWKQAMLRTAAENVARALRGEPVRNVVDRSAYLI
ncbi:MAG: 2-hydroxyacid dehydrogenase [Candidatus Methanofastidiosa archaeon]|nr:2-hydroxyacid dehydrogenase [Candidatus Methanofastidiosa archaeon]